MYNLSIDQLIMRFYLMMLAVVVPMYIGIPALAFLALPILLSAMFGIQFKIPKKQSRSKSIEKRKSISAIAE